MKKRLDIALVERGLVTGRDKAKAVIMAGQVYVNEQKSDKAGEDVKDEDKIEVRGDTLKYVSRGGLKLEKSIPQFSLELKDKVCADFGASTGGFTDCMLKNGAKKVYALDVGYGQLAWSLRVDERVVNMERTNVRHLELADVEPIDFLSADLSFISLSLILPAANRVLKTGGQAVCLVKPQFEAGREKVGKKGVVRDASVHKEVIEKCISYAINNGFMVKGISFSPITGPEGNIEYLMHIEKSETPEISQDINIAEVVEDSHKTLKAKEN